MTKKKQTNKQTDKKKHQQRRRQEKNTPSYSQRQGQHYDKKNMPNLKKPKKMRRAHQTFRPSTGVLSSYIRRLTNKISL